AVWTPDGAQLIPNALGETLTPSVVNVTDGEVTVGRSAGEQLITRPDDTIAAFKRWMGTEKIVRLDNRPFRAEELSSLVLASLKRDAEA
ncbi:Hsp70 family protein, partial [Acinetobacter baumannii]